MAEYEALRILKYIIEKNILVKNCKVLLLGATFKPNVPDLRNSKVQDLAEVLASYGVRIYIHEPFSKEKTIFGFEHISNVSNIDMFDIVVKTVNHACFKEIHFDYGVLQ